MPARSRSGRFTKGGRSKSRAMVRYVAKPVVRYRTRTVAVRRGRGRRAHQSSSAELKELAYDFGASAGYGYLREGGTDSFNEFMDKVPLGTSLGKDLRNGLVFYALDKYAIKSQVLRRLAKAAIYRAGYKFGQSKFTKLEGGHDAVSGSMG
jgi:hypothetical protein